MSRIVGRGRPPASTSAPVAANVRFGALGRPLRECRDDGLGPGRKRAGALLYGVNNMPSQELGS